MNTQFIVCFCTRIMPTPAETSQESLPTCVAFWAGAGDVASALIARAAARGGRIRVLMEQASKCRRDFGAERPLSDSACPAYPSRGANSLRHGRQGITMKHCQL